MKKTNQAGSAGKGFYAALSLSVAMVGAACWYAWSEAGKLVTPAPEPKLSAEYSRPAVTTATAAAIPAQTTAVPQVRRTEPTAEAEEAAALLHKTTPTTAVTAAETEPQPVETEPPVEIPLPPVEGEMIQRFSHGELVKSQTTGIWSTHNGMDIAAPYGTEVCVTEDGTVTSAGRDALLGITVTVLHENGTVTRYSGLNEGLNVQAGDVIRRGTVLGAVGDTNESESALEPHLHFEVQHNDSYIDPESYLCGALNKPQNTEASEE